MKFVRFVDSGNLLAFGYRLPEKSYAIFRLPPPANAAGFFKEVVPSKTRVSNNNNGLSLSLNLNRARKMATFDQQYIRDKKEISSNNFEKDSETKEFQVNPDKNQTSFHESEVSDPFTEDYTKVEKVEMTTIESFQTPIKNISLPTTQPNTKTIPTSISISSLEQIFQPTPLTIQTTEFTKTTTENVDLNPKNISNNSIFEIFPTSENENFLTSSEMISDFGDITIEKDFLNDKDEEEEEVKIIETISNDFSVMDTTKINEIQTNKEKYFLNEQTEDILMTKTKESTFPTVEKQSNSNFTDYEYEEEIKETLIELSKTNDNSTNQNSDILLDNNSKFETDDSVFPTFQTEMDRHLKNKTVETEFEAEEDLSEVITNSLND